jgi:hypothetical protein
LLHTQPNDIAGLVTIQPVNDPADLTVPPNPPLIRDIGLRNVNPAANLLGIGPPIYARNFTIIFDNAPVILPETTLTGYMDIIAGGVTAASTAITETGVLTVAGTSTFTVDTVQQADVLLDIEPNDLAGAVTITTINGGTIRDVGLRNVNPSANLVGVPTILRNLTIIFDNAAVNLPLTTLTGNLAVYAGGGPITQSDVLTVAGTSFLAANDNSITLTNVNNDFGGTVSLITLVPIDPNTNTRKITGLNPASIVDINGVDLGPAVIPATVAAALPANPFTDGSYSVDGFDHGTVSVDGHLSVVAEAGNITDSGLVLYYNGGTFQVMGGYSIIIDNNPLFRIYIVGSGGTVTTVPQTELNVILGQVQNLAQAMIVLINPDAYFLDVNLFTIEGDTIISNPSSDIILRRIFR